jgi:DNA-binding response OmpR family regulator
LSAFVRRAPCAVTRHASPSFEGADVAQETRGLSSAAGGRPAGGELYAFGAVRIDVARHVVSRDGHPIALAPKTFELLLILVRSCGRAISRQELIAALWPDTFVEEANLSFQVSMLRRALGDSSGAAGAGGEGARRGS